MDQWTKWHREINLSSDSTQESLQITRSLLEGVNNVLLFRQRNCLRQLTCVSSSISSAKVWGMGPAKLTSFLPDDSSIVEDTVRQPRRDIAKCYALSDWIDPKVECLQFQINRNSSAIFSVTPYLSKWSFKKRKRFNRNRWQSIDFGQKLRVKATGFQWTYYRKHTQHTYSHIWTVSLVTIFAFFSLRDKSSTCHNNLSQHQCITTSITTYMRLLKA